jgi:hypothetical protein
MKYTIFLVFTLISLNVLAQQKQFPLDERGKYIYYEIADAKTTNKDSLLFRAKYFINTLYKKSIKQESLTDSSILAKGKVIIDKTILVAGHPSGEVSYNLTFEARDKKYRFWLTDFEYIPYQRDRYGNYVQSTKIGTALEKVPGKLSSGEWKDIVESTYNKVSKIAADFKKNLATNQIESPKKKTETISTKKW